MLKNHLCYFRIMQLKESLNLVQKLIELETFKSIGLETGLIVNEEEIEIKRRLILKSFYDKNKLAYDVSRGIESYVKLIEPIEERYNSLWKKSTTPKKNPKLEEEIIKVFTSINNIGAAYIPNIESFTRNGRIKAMQPMDIFSLLTGMTFSSLSYLNITNTNLSNLSNYYYLIPVSFLVLPYLVLRPTDATLKYSLEALHQSAEKTDNYLRKNTI